MGPAQVAPPLPPGFELDPPPPPGFELDQGPAAAAPMTRDQLVDQIPAGPGMAPQRGLGARPRPQPTVGDKVVGAVEAGIGILRNLVGGTVGGVGGAAVGVVEDVANLARGQQPDPQNLERRMNQGVQVVMNPLGLPTQTLTPQGEEYTEQASGMLNNLPAYVPMIGPAQGLAAGMEGAAALARGLAQRPIDKIGAVIDRVIPTGQPAAPAAGTKPAAGAAGTDMATQRRQRAEALPIPIKLTKGDAERTFEQQRFERETAKDPELGKPIREAKAEQNERLLQNFDLMAEQTGAEAPDARAAGQRVVSAIERKVEKAKEEIRAAYQEADAAGELAEAVPTDALVAKLREIEPSATNAGVIKTAEQELIRLGGASRDADGNLVAGELPLSSLEELRKTVGKGGAKDATNATFAREIRGVIDKSTEGRGGERYQAARKLYADYAGEFKNKAAISRLLRNKPGTTDRTVAIEDVVDSSVLRGSRADLEALKTTLRGSGDDGVQAWREVQGRALNHLKEQATKNVARDERGNPIISAAGLDRAVKAMDADGKLDLLFGKNGAAKLRDLNDLAKDVYTAPPGSVNTSNTASVLLTALDTLVTFGASGAPIPAITALRAAVKKVKARKVQKQVREAVGDDLPAAAARADADPAARPFDPDDPPPAPKPPPPPPPAPPAPRGTPAAGESLLGVEHQVGGRDPHKVSYERRADDGRLTRVIEYPDGQRSQETLVTNKNGDESWVSNEGYERGEWYPVKTSKESAEVHARDDLGDAAPKAGPTRAPDPRLAEIERLKADASPETTKVLDEQAKQIERAARAERVRARRAEEAQRLDEAAAATSDPQIRQALLARANQLRPERLPTGEATEVRPQPAAKGKTEPVPAGAARELDADAARAAQPTPREAEIGRLLDKTTDPGVRKDLERQLAAERKRVADGARGQEYLRLADEATDPALRADLEAKAKKLGATRQIPVAETSEVLPTDDMVDAFKAQIEAETAWRREHKLSELDADRAKLTAQALLVDEAAVARAAEQFKNQPRAFDRAVQGIIDEGKQRAIQQRQDPPGGEGLEPGAGEPVSPAKPKPGQPGPDGAAATRAERAAPAGEGRPAEALTKARAALERATEPTGNPITDRLSERIRSDYAGTVKAYEGLNDSRGGRVLNTDIARELSDDYLADRTRSADVHEPASAFIKRLYAEKLAAPTPQGTQRRVMFTAGGTGAGKTTGQAALGDALGTPEITFDTNMNTMASAVDKIEQALEAGRDVRIVYTYADPLQAFEQAMNRANSQKGQFGSGRTVPIADHVDTHVGASKVIRDLVDKYRNDLRVDFFHVDNSRGKGNAARADLAGLPLVTDNGLRGQLEAIAREAHRAGRIDAATLAGFLGESPARVRVEGMGRAVPGPVQRGGAGQREGARQEVAAPPAASIAGPAGSSTSVVTESGMRVPVRYRLVDVGQLITSHTDELAPNPAFPAEFQPRDRSRDASRAQITRIENDLKPELLADSPKASDGSPIIGADGLVESGNARTIAMRRAYGSGKADAYAAWLAENAERFGLTAEQVRATKRPVLVRERTVDVDRADFARQANESPVAAMSDTELAVIEGNRLPDLEGLVTNDDGTINLQRSVDFIRDYMRTVAAPGERGQLMTADGRLSQRGVQRIRNAVFAKAYGDTDLVAKMAEATMAEATDGNTRNVLAGLLRAAPQVARLRELSAAGARGSADFVPQLVEAVRRFSDARADGQTVAQYLGQGSLIGGEASPEVGALMRQLEIDSRAPRRIADMVEQMVQRIDGAGDPRQAGMFN